MVGCLLSATPLQMASSSLRVRLQSRYLPTLTNAAAMKPTASDNEETQPLQLRSQTLKFLRVMEENGLYSHPQAAFLKKDNPCFWVLNLETAAELLSDVPKLAAYCVEAIKQPSS